jgi:hypothetical protein
LIFNGSTLSCDFISATQLSANITAARVNNPGAITVRVSNPLPGGGSSNIYTFDVGPLGLSILTRSLPNAHNAKPYSYTLQANGGVPPYDWSVTSGSLPNGMDLSSDGEIYGTPPVLGVDTNYPFSAQVHDSSAIFLTADTDFTILVQNDSLGRNDTCSADSATAISNGLLRASLSPYGDIDVYSFQGTQGRPVTVETFAQRITLYGDPASRDVYMDSFLELLDDGCHAIQYSDDIDLGVVFDSKISEFSLPYTGTYYIRVSDLRGDGRPDFQYDLELSGAD